MGPGGAVGGVLAFRITHEQATELFLDLVAAPIEPAVLQAPKAPRGRPRRPARTPATATRRSYRLSCKKNLFPAAQGNVMAQARRLVMSKCGLAIPERGEVVELRLPEYQRIFDEPLSPVQIEALSALARAGKNAASPAPASS